MVFGFSDRKRDNVLPLTPPYDKVSTNKGAITGGGFPVTSITCIVGIRVGLHEKMTVFLIKKTTSMSMLEIYK